MALSQRNGVLLLFVVPAVCIQLYQAHDILGRCSCRNTIMLIKGNVSDFEVLEKRPGCDRIELIVTRTGPATNSTDRLCMNTQGKVAKALLKCWEKINKDESRKTECIDRMMAWLRRNVIRA